MDSYKNMKIYVFLVFLKPVLASSENCGNDAYFGPTGRCELCGKLCDRPAGYPASCNRLCPNYIARDRFTTTPIPIKYLEQTIVISESCGNEAYFGPTGKCEPCGELCDRPVWYPVSCKRFCPYYVAKDRPIYTTSSALPKQNSTPWLIGGFAGLCVFITVLLLGIPIWQKHVKPFLTQQAAQRERRKLHLSTQVENDQQEMTQMLY